MKKDFLIKILVLTLAGVVIGGIFIFKLPKFPQEIGRQRQVGAPANWEYDMTSKNWRARGTIPNCPDPIVFPAPVDVKLASGVLYPGQERGGDYKAHGGFRLDGLKNNSVNVYAPFEGNLIQAARHTTESDEIQYVLYVLNDCGLMYKLDHLLELTDKFQKILESVPLAGINDTRTTGISPQVFVDQGELVATKVGLQGNVFFDFGVYDLRQRNGADYSGRNYYNIEQYGMHALCWLNNLEEPGKSIVNNLPAADGKSGSKSDYCHQ